jgi:hypothetical protein
MKKDYPEPGFYHHYKHNPNNPINNYAYEVIGIGHHTEDNCRPEDKYLVVYRPLYEEAFVYIHGKMFDVRPYDMWIENIEKEGKNIPRFTKITDSKIIKELQDIKTRMYPEI